MENQPSYGFLGAIGINIHRHPSKLSLVVSGLEQKAGRIARVSMFSDPKINTNIGTSLIINLFEFLDLTLIVKIVFFFLGIFISTLANATSTTMVISLLIWVIIVILIPSTSVLLGTKFYPIQAPYEIESQKDMILQNIQKEADREVLEWIANHPGESMTPELISSLNQKYLNKREREARKVEESYTKKLLTQLNISINIARVSPASCLSFAVMNLAETGFMTQQRFLQALNKYQGKFTNYINEKTKNIEQIQKVDLHDMPKFEYSKMSFKESLKLSLIDILILCIYLIFLFVGAYVSFLRYDLR
ncbi:MAG: DUF3526 domain-containing protein [Acidobacteriota bacterium]|nr:DUF3526 domain-containing protein [Acidobacteriota bacterium]